MRYLIASDIHGSAACAAQLSAAFQRESADRLLLLGDLLYHGPRNDLPEGYAPKEAAASLNGNPSRILAVRGNCDADVDQLLLDFPIGAAYAAVEAGGRLLYLIHSEKDAPALPAGDVVLSGHTHIPGCETRDGVLFLNPGSVSLPKNGSPRSYMTFDGTVFIWKTLEGEEFLRHTL